MKKTVLAPLLAAVFAISSCASGVDGFRDEEAKRVAWDAVQCKSFGELSAGPIETDLRMKLLWDDFAPDERDDAQWWANRLSKADTVSDAMQYESGEGYSNLCSGWLWERRKKEDKYMDGYEDFSYQDAEEAGIFGS